jgi:hypothetical protein
MLIWTLEMDSPYPNTYVCSQGPPILELSATTSNSNSPPKTEILDAGPQMQFEETFTTMADTDEPSPPGDIQLNEIVGINNSNGPTTLDLSNNR